MTLWKAIKAGKLANGAELGQGRIVHIIESDYGPYASSALCGDYPKIQWSTLHDGAQVTCPKCLRIVQANPSYSKDHGRSL